MRGRGRGEQGAGDISRDEARQERRTANGVKATDATIGIFCRNGYVGGTSLNSCLNFHPTLSLPCRNRYAIPTLPSIDVLIVVPFHGLASPLFVRITLDDTRPEIIRKIALLLPHSERLLLLLLIRRVNQRTVNVCDQLQNRTLLRKHVESVDDVLSRPRLSRCVFQDIVHERDADNTLQVCLNKKAIAQRVRSHHAAEDHIHVVLLAVTCVAEILDWPPGAVDPVDEDVEGVGFDVVQYYAAILGLFPYCVVVVQAGDEVRRVMCEELLVYDVRFAFRTDLDSYETLWALLGESAVECDGLLTRLLPRALTRTSLSKEPGEALSAEASGSCDSKILEQADRRESRPLGSLLFGECPIRKNSSPELISIKKEQAMILRR
ncbi:hypothetical protein P171DRAFT_446756 [Karstenula rhodostoma CBS 690.94]|uniref:Uncharacterized protein n=1 Tax=Karstenula rhodostoma CBS 690.94 TaxID=1392251 RepID=A0A9P4PFF7_9PLEO|nr:hypothetical protein P171DRAFT_446756 [Karstenula rhodostoma CBS 690.94]